MNENVDFNELIKEGLTLVDFYATWCGPCKMLSPIIESLEDRIKVIRIDIDKYSDLTREYRIMSVPTLIFFKDGKKCEEIIGFHSKEEIEEIMDRL